MILHHRSAGLAFSQEKRKRAMTIRDILVYLDVGEGSDQAPEFALSLAEQTGAHVTAASITLRYLPLGMVQNVGVYDAFTQLTDESRVAVDNAYKKFEAAAPAGVQCELAVIEATDQEASDRFGELGRHFDFSIVGQGDAEMAEQARLMIQGALFYSGKPVLIVPNAHKGPARLGKAIVCWDASVAAARAVAGALPLLRRAGKVEVLRVSEEGQAPADLPGFNIARHLVRHGVSATLKDLPPAADAAAAILSYAAENRPDYLVMGGYGHWKMREFVFGGTTRTMLSSMPAPLFMAH